MLPSASRKKFQSSSNISTTKWYRPYARTPPKRCGSRRKSSRNLRTTWNSNNVQASSREAHLTSLPSGSQCCFQLRYAVFRSHYRIVVERLQSSEGSACRCASASGAGVHRRAERRSADQDSPESNGTRSFVSRQG